MLKPLSFGSVLMLSTALTTPAPAQTAPATAAALVAPAEATTPAGETPDDQVEISTPGGATLDSNEIVVTGRNIPNSIRTTPAVISVLSTEEIARTGEGDIAGALGRVTGLSVVGNGFVYVRGLGDRYSLALLNGLPLPSPEPLRRVVPLDIFPTDLVGSAVVQKSFSANYPGEFGGGVINLTTKAIPDESFLSVAIGGSYDTRTSGKLGYVYDGGTFDYLGFDNGIRDTPKGIASALAAGNFNGATTSADRRELAKSLVNAETSVLQRNDDIPLNGSASISAGTAIDTGFGRVGVIAAAGYYNSWRTRDALQQASTDPALGVAQSDFQNIITDNRILVNGLLGIGAEIGDHKIRWTNLYIRDTLKQGRLASGYNRSISDPIEGQPDQVLQQRTSWTERQLIDTQVVGEFKFDRLSVDLRGTYANTQRESPYERSFTYVYDATAQDYVNRLSGGTEAYVVFSNLEENLWAGGIDLAYKFDSTMPITLSAGYAYSDQKRTSSRYQLDYFSPNGALPFAVSQERPDYLISRYNIDTYGIELRDSSSALGAAAYDAGLKIQAGYAQLAAEVLDGVSLTAGVRYEDGKEFVQPIGAGVEGTRIANSYWLPAATVTWNFADNMQLRVAGSKTLARPQFRELARQIFFDFESDRQYVGNPFLQDSKLWNAEARWEWYFDRDQRLSVAGFYKKIDNPIEPVLTIAGGSVARTGFANAPEANLYGAEVEFQKYVPLDAAFNVPFFATRRAVLIANYTYSQSKLKVGDETVIGPNLNEVAANVLYRDGAPLTGQSDHLVNLQLGLEDTDRLSQQTILLTYASKRVTNRGPIQGNARQPDLVEKPGLRLDFVARQGITIGAVDLELKFEARNLTGTKYQEYQTAGENTIYINRYNLGRVYSLGLGVRL